MVSAPEIGPVVILTLFDDRAADRPCPREQIEQGIQIEVRNAMQAVRSGEARLRAAAIARENSQKQYESEQRKLDEGQSDVYRVLERQTALIAAKSIELKARTDLNKAIVDLERATGNSLKANDITPTK